MILNDIERAVVCGKQEYRTNADFIDAIEQAIIAKLAQGVVMPEPVGYLDGQGDSYTADQLRAYGAACRLKALEDAAEIAVNGLGLTTVSVASRIRALKGAA